MQAPFFGAFHAIRSGELDLHTFEQSEERVFELLRHTPQNQVDMLPSDYFDQPDYAELLFQQ
jgi:hypothetical protein